MTTGEDLLDTLVSGSFVGLDKAVSWAAGFFSFRLDASDGPEPSCFAVLAAEVGGGLVSSETALLELGSFFILPKLYQSPFRIQTTVGTTSRNKMMI